MKEKFLGHIYFWRQITNLNKSCLPFHKVHTPKINFGLNRGSCLNSLPPFKVAFLREDWEWLHLRQFEQIGNVKFHLNFLTFPSLMFN